ncbi:hypothetical protein Verru16b_02835 [Lacunisphaera limnophila]|uniref:Methyltransferase type 11 domain-containing protein n=2 Tax=Lacunisphaera limnophila TaxID=1838286 RepID=A0A1D8AXY0_9BACT|nr:hypothetical protein Verru16b_02835 [Lacunisphaera limnophila]
MNKLNIGCGHRALPGWTNVDFVSVPGLVQAHDLREPLPFAAGSFALVYHSHVLEHLDRDGARRLLQECHRVLQPGGLLRVVVPDLEQKARLYLEKLELAATRSEARTLADHEWTVVEMIDQLVRTRSGGEMLRWLQEAAPDSFAARRIGDEFQRAQAGARQVAAPRGPAPRPGVRERLARRLRQLAGVSETEWDWLRYRRLGEAHLWMYDRVSLATLLNSTGFTGCEVTTAGTSRQPDWATDGLWLDVEAGSPRKPDSLYLEAVKPPAPAT